MYFLLISQSTNQSIILTALYIFYSCLSNLLFWVSLSNYLDCWSTSIFIQQEEIIKIAVWQQASLSISVMNVRMICWPFCLLSPLLAVREALSFSSRVPWALPNIQLTNKTHPCDIKCYFWWWYNCFQNYQEDFWDVFPWVGLLHHVWVGPFHTGGVLFLALGVHTTPYFRGMIEKTMVVTL